MVMWIMSDRTIPRSLRMIEAFGIHSFRLINAEGESTFVKFHWRPKLGLSRRSGRGRQARRRGSDFHRRDMFEAIAAGNFPEWEFAVQLFTERRQTLPIRSPRLDQADSRRIGALEGGGRMVLDRWPNNFFAETEQVAYCPSHVVPGIDFSNDPLCAGTSLLVSRHATVTLGLPNFHQIPINAPKCPFANHQRDGHMQMEQPKVESRMSPTRCRKTPPRASGRWIPQRCRDGDGSEEPDSCRELRRPLHPGATVLSEPVGARAAHIASALVFELSKVEHPHIREAMVGHLRNIEESLATRVAAGLAMNRMPAAPAPAAPIRAMKPSPALQIISKMKDTLAGGHRHPDRRRLGRRHDPEGPQSRDRRRCRREDRRPKLAARSSPTVRCFRWTDNWPERRQCCSTA
jgi:catalase